MQMSNLNSVMAKVMEDEMETGVGWFQGYSKGPCSNVVYSLLGRKVALYQPT